jgi:hypothetical protein
MKNEPDEIDHLVKLARQNQYHMDEGFYDPENKSKPNYIKSERIELERSEMPEELVEKMESTIAALAERAGVSEEAAADAIASQAMEHFLRKLGQIEKEAAQLGVPFMELYYKRFPKRRKKP